MRACLFSLVVFCSALPLIAQNKHPFTFEDMMTLKRVEEPEVSADGKWVLFAAVDVDLRANTKTPHVWVVPLTPDGDSHVSQKQGDMGHPSDGSKEREIVSDQDADRPRWAPDGKRFAFVSTKENGSQIWIADFDSATGTVTGTHRLTNIATEADGELWSPDGKNILFKSDVYPECDGTPQPEAECNAKKLEEKKNSKVKALVFTHLLYRHWNAYKEGKRTHLFVVAVSAGEGARPTHGEEIKGPTLPQQAGQGWGTPVSVARDLTPGDYDAPVFSLGGQDDYAFSPDGQEICYASNHDPEPAISTNNDLFTVPVNGGTGVSPVQVLAATKNITAENKAADNTPLYSPDGKYIAYRAQQRPGYESDQWRLTVFDRKTRRKTQFAPTTKTDFWVGTFAWGPDSSIIYFVADDKGESPIYSVSFDITNVDKAAGGDVTIHSTTLNYVEITRGFNDDIAVPGSGNSLLFTRMSVERPNEIHRAHDACLAMNSKSNCWTSEAVTHVNDSVLSQVSMSPLESFWFTGAHGDKVQGWIVKPPNFDPNKKYPVKFIVHGGPEVPFGDEWSYRWNFELFAANGYMVVFINFHGSPGYGQKFIDAINGDWGGAPFEDLMKGLDYAEAHYGFIDKDRECALGASYGGYMANWILGHTNRFKCIVTHDGMFNPFSAWGTTEELWFNEWEFKGTPYTNHDMYNKWSPRNSSPNFKTPTLVIHSQLDYRLDVSEGFQLFTTLQRMGVPSKMLYFPDEGHWVLKPQNSQLWYKTVNDWVDQWVGK
jgi:dipeptidyl aminopeptidase/acylaminoacyl peptidase